DGQCGEDDGQGGQERQYPEAQADDDEHRDKDGAARQLVAGDAIQDSAKEGASAKEGYGEAERDGGVVLVAREDRQDDGAERRVEEVGDHDGEHDPAHQRLAEDVTQAGTQVGNIPAAPASEPRGGRGSSDGDGQADNQSGDGKGCGVYPQQSAGPHDGD